MNPHYYLMKSKKILRLEEEMSFSSLPHSVKQMVLDPEDIIELDQEQANWRVVIFRDEIMEFDEFTNWLESDEAKSEREYF
ncbi:MAG: hypothetical protein AB7I27_18480 [Bacteriovoracaceae bacterium]